MLLFSIITICKDTLNDLKLTYNSILTQTNKNFEWIVIDGGSTDETKEWLETNDLPAYWVSEQDNGIYNAMNKGIKFAQGKYIIFMNSADEFANKNVLKDIEIEIIKSNYNPILIFGDSFDIDEEGNQYYRKAKNFNQIKYGMITQHQAIFFNLQLCSDILYEEKYPLSADYALICKIIKNRNSYPIQKLAFPICKFKMGGVNEKRRYQAIAEDYIIRRDILKMNVIEASFLYLLHFIHTIIKHNFSKLRFARHKSINP